ncbi:MAG: glycosyltransferase family 4 protein [Anaerolineae bacterium]|nr:glycosyltransferase family 4 protein [Anaerolineae bacterium]
MRLLVIGHTAHYRHQGQIVGWGPTVKEIDWLARAFDSVTHLACFHPGPAPDSALPYAAKNVQFDFVPPAGGLTLAEKLRAFSCAPIYMRKIMKNLAKADVVQIRSPGILAMYAMVLLRYTDAQKQRWVKYAGNWMQTGKRPTSYIFQRWWLANGYCYSPVTVNGQWPDQPGFIFPFFNPSMTVEEIQTSRALAINKQIATPIRLLFVGRTETAKGVGRSIQIVQGLRQRGQDVLLDIVGDGPERSKFERMAETLGLGNHVKFRGWIPHHKVHDFMTQAHILLLPSNSSEGWPKVLSEAMLHGTVPVASDVSAIPQILAQTKAGVTHEAHNIDAFVDTITGMIQNPDLWKRMSMSGMNAAPSFTYEHYLLALDAMFTTLYGSSPLDQTTVKQMQKSLGSLGPVGV